jgi:oligopeptide/dipeptide ABC transporter ATP-binding protein
VLERGDKNMTLLELKNISKIYKTPQGSLKALNGITLTIPEGSTVGLVGESGCGKSTLGRIALALENPTQGDVVYNGESITYLPKKRWKALRRSMQMIFQDPYASLNPCMTLQEIIGEPLDIHRLAKGKERVKRIEQLLQLVGLSSHYMSRFPHELSGGQRQRVGIARALAVEPRFLVLDEPLSALDVSVQAQVVNLLNTLQKELSLTYLLISHDLALVKYLSDFIAVMYLGELMEWAPGDLLHKEPLHPYSEALLSAISLPDPDLERKKKRIVLKGDLPSPLDPPKGCPFASRCPKVMPHCHTKKPPWKEAQPGRFVACHLF